MLKPAQLYQIVLETKILEIWYDPKYQFLTCEPAISLPDLSRTNLNTHSFVSVDENDEVIGYIAYNVDWVTRSAYGIEIASFDIGNPRFAYDVFKAVRDIFRKYNLYRLGFSAVYPSPLIRIYNTITDYFGGGQCGHSHHVAMLQDGTIRDVIDYEILAYDFQDHHRKT